MPCDDVVSVASAVLSAPARLGAVRMLAVDGPSGAGKTTLAALIRDELVSRGVATALVPTDHFATWQRPVEWWPELVTGVLEPLSDGDQGGYRAIEWSSGYPLPGEWIVVDVPAVLIVEGVSSGRTSVWHNLSHLCWISGPDEATRLARSVARDGAAEREHLRAWQRFERAWFLADRTAERADSRISTVSG